MPAPQKSELRRSLQHRFAVLTAENPLMPLGKIHDALAQDFALTKRMVWYYLRPQSDTDSRLHYTDEERAKLCSMSRKQLKTYAEAHGKVFNTLYAMVWRVKTRGVDTKTKAERHAQKRVVQGYMDFSRLSDLKAFGFPRDAFKAARKIIKGIKDLDLLPPNLLIHPPSQKFYALTLDEQRVLLQNPRWYIQQNAAHISANWQSYKADNHYFLLLDTQAESPTYEGRVISAHSTLETAAANACIARTSTKIHRRIGSASNSGLLRYLPGDLVPRMEVAYPTVPVGEPETTQNQHE